MEGDDGYIGDDNYRRLFSFDDNANRAIIYFICYIIVDVTLYKNNFFILIIERECINGKNTKKS